MNVHVQPVAKSVSYKMADTGNRFVIANQILTPQMAQTIFYQ